MAVSCSVDELTCMRVCIQEHSRFSPFRDDVQSVAPTAQPLHCKLQWDSEASHTHTHDTIRAPEHNQCTIEIVILS